MGCDEDLLKCLVFWTNFILALIGICLISLGIIYKINLEELTEAIPDEYNDLTSIPALVIPLGTLLIFLAVFGCYVCLTEKIKYIIPYIAILLTIFVIQLTVGVTAFYKLGDETIFKNRLDVTAQIIFEKYGLPKNKPIIDLIQHRLKCCGFNGSQYWVLEIPKSCRNVNSLGVYENSCKDQLFDYIKYSLHVLGTSITMLSLSEVLRLSLLFLCTALLVQSFPLDHDSSESSSPNGKDVVPGTQSSAQKGPVPNSQDSSSGTTTPAHENAPNQDKIDVPATLTNSNRKTRDADQQSPSSTPQKPQEPVPSTKASQADETNDGSSPQSGKSPITQTNTPTRNVRDVDNQQSPPKTDSVVDLKPQAPVPYSKASQTDEALKTKDESPPQTEKSSITPTRNVRDVDNQQTTPKTDSVVDLKPQAPVPFSKASQTDEAIKTKDESSPQTEKSSIAPTRNVRDVDNQQSTPKTDSVVDLKPQVPVPYTGSSGQTVKSDAQVNHSNRQVRDVDNQQSTTGGDLKPTKPSGSSPAAHTTDSNVKSTNSENLSSHATEKNTDVTTEEPDHVQIVHLDNSPPFAEE